MSVHSTPTVQRPPTPQVTGVPEKPAAVLAGTVVLDRLMVKDSRTNEPLVTIGGHADGGRVDLWRRADPAAGRQPEPNLSLIASKNGGLVIVYGQGGREEIRLMLGCFPPEEMGLSAGVIVSNELRETVGSFGVDDLQAGRLNLGSADGERKVTAVALENGGGVMLFGQIPDQQIAVVGPNDGGGGAVQLYGSGESEEPLAILSAHGIGSMLTLHHAETRAAVLLAAHPELGCISSYDADGKLAFPEIEEADAPQSERETLLLAAGEAA